MSDKLQQAIQATRAGDTKNAQFLLTQAIQEDPNDPQSWYLLSLLVDDKEKKQTYLTKVIEIDPDHTRAHEQLVAIAETAVPDILEEPELIEAEEAFEPEAVVVLSSDSPDLEAQDEGETLPDWMAGDLPSGEEIVEGVIAETAVSAPSDATEAEAVPDWLDESLGEEWGGEKETAVIEEAVLDETKGEAVEPPSDKVEKEQKQAAAKEKKPEKAKKEASEKQLNYILTGLIVVAIIIFIIMAYLIFTM